MDSIINSSTQYHHDSSSDDDIDDLDSRITKYANIKSKPIEETGAFTDSDSSSSDEDEDEKNIEEEEDDSSDSSSSDSSSADDNNADKEETESVQQEKEKEQQQQQSFNVSIRCRPLFAKEKMLEYKNVIKVVDAKYVILKSPEVANKNDYHSMRRDRQKRFQFDHVFDSSIATDVVYKQTARGVVRSILSGYNGTVFAYGATGSGKTFTMLGDDNNPGVMVHTLSDLFKWKEKESEKYNFRIVISFLEIYNEMICDLLVKQKKKKKKKKYLDLRETPKQGVIVSGITFRPANNVSEVMDLLNEGNKRRTTESTAANKVSSRSHAMLQVYVERKAKDMLNDGGDVRMGKLNLIDLAGSEKGSVVKSGNKSGMREGANINKSLLALSKCINSLVEKRKFIPYRDSKLTRLLQDALGGNSRTVMICNISPSSHSWDDTMNTLKYADRAKNIKINKLQINKMKNQNKNDLNTVINALKSQVDALKTQLTVNEKEKKMMKRRSKLMMKEQKHEMMQTLASFKEQNSKKKSLLTQQDLQILNAAKQKLKNTMIILDDLMNNLANLNDEETDLMTQQLSMQQILAMNEDNNETLETNYNDLCRQIDEISQKKEETEAEINNIAQNVSFDKQHQNKHLDAMIQREKDLFLANVNNKRKELNLSFMQKMQKSQKFELEKMAKENKKKDELLKNLQIAKEEYEDKIKENELKLQREIDKFEELKLAQIKKENEPKRKLNFKASDIPHTKWDKDDLYFWLLDDLHIEEKYAKLIYLQGFDGESIAEIKEEDLREIGIDQMGVRKKIFKNADLLLQQSKMLNGITSQSTLATSVAWNSMYGLSDFNHESVKSEMSSASSMRGGIDAESAKKQIKIMQQQLKMNPAAIENESFMMSMLALFASSQNLTNLPTTNVNSNPSIPELPEEEPPNEEKEEKMHSPPPTNDNDNGEEEEEDEVNEVNDLLKEKESAAKLAVSELAHKITASMTQQQMENMNLSQLKEETENESNEDDEENNVDSDDDLPYDYNDEWMYKDKEHSFNLILLSPYKSLRKLFLNFCFEEIVISNRKRTLSYKRYEKKIKCGNEEFVFRILECYECNYIPELFDHDIIAAIIMLFPLDKASVSLKEIEFMQDIDTWLKDSGHWNSFWQKTTILLHGALSFSKKHRFASLDDYFEFVNERKQSLNEHLFQQFNVENDVQKKYILMDTNTKSKLKIKEMNGKKYKFKWPKIPKPQNSNGHNCEDFRAPFTYNLFLSLTEPNKSYFLTAALFSPKKNLMAPEFESTAKNVAANGPFGGGGGLTKEQKEENEENEHKLKPMSNVKLPLSDSPQSVAENVAILEKSETESIIDNAAILEDQQIEIDEHIQEEEIMVLPSAPPIIVDDDNENENNENVQNDDFEQKKQLMQEAFIKFQQRKQKIEQKQEQITKLADDYNISGPPPKQQQPVIIIEDEEEEYENGNVTPPNLESDGGGSVTPPLDDEYFMISPSPFFSKASNNHNDNGSNKPIISGNQLNVNNSDKNENRRVSKGYHGYQPSWASSNNKFQSQLSYYTATSFFDQVIDSNMNGYAHHQSSFANSSLNQPSDSDDDIDDELDFATKSAVSSPKKKFSQKYIEKNRNQSIMRYQDIFDQSTKASKNIEDSPNYNNQQRISGKDEFSPKLLDLNVDESSFMIERRGSKYSHNEYNNNNGYRKRTSSYTTPIDRKQSVSSTHSYSMKKEFGAKRRNKKNSNMLKRMWKWTKD